MRRRHAMWVTAVVAGLCSTGPSAADGRRVGEVISGFPSESSPARLDARPGAPGAQRLHIDGAGFVRLRLSRISLPAKGWIEIRDGAGALVERIDPEPGAAMFERWTTIVVGADVDVRLHAGPDGLGASCEVNAAVRGDARGVDAAGLPRGGAEDGAGGIAGDPCMPACATDFSPACFQPGALYDLRTPVCRVHVVTNRGEARVCTGWMIGAPDCALTTWRCMEDALVTATLLEFNAECDGCEGGRNTVGATYRVEQVLASDEGLDWAMLDTTGAPGLPAPLGWGILPVTTSAPAEGSPLLAISHSGGGKKVYSFGVATAVDAPGACGGDPVTVQVTHTCALARGAAGAPLICGTNLRVTFMHHCWPAPPEGPDLCMAPGFAVPLAMMAPALMDAMDAHGCVYDFADSPCMSCPDSTHNCFTTGEPGCLDATCCAAVCATIPTCCIVVWDQSCVDAASTLCDGCGDPAAGDCCTGHAGPYCDNRICCDLVCAVDPFCCDVTWDDLCAGDAAAYPECACVEPCPPGGHNCFTVGDPGCSDGDCCVKVCAIDPFCCDVVWDAICVDEASLLCDGCGDPAAGDCCAAHVGAYCDDRTCCDLVCAVDPFCCDVTWDDLCAGDAAAYPECACVEPCPPGGHNCFTVGDPGCSDPDCCVKVCAIDPFCCDVVWDAICVDEASLLCDGCGDPAAGDCCAAHVGAYCDDRTCCDLVCAVDPFCCDVAWDELCADEAATHPECGCPQCPCACPGDINCDGMVDGADLGLLLADWLMFGSTYGPCGCSTDIDCDGFVRGDDLGVLIGAWGACPTPVDDPTP